MARGARRLGAATPLATGALAALALTLAPQRADAQLLQRFALRGELGVGVMLPEAQRTVLGLESPHLQLTGRLAFNVVDWLSIQASINTGFFFTSGQPAPPTGGVLMVLGGLRIEPMIGTVGRLWIDGNIGLASTGTQRRLGVDGGLGFEFQAARWLGIGPMARIHFIPHDPAVNAPSDALYLSFGVSFSLRVAPDEPRAAPADRDGDGVLDPSDQCVDVPQGAHPDPARTGCPLGDADGDGVLDPDDQCPSVPKGDHPDPARQGCPLGDADGDGVLDPDDQCPTVPQGEHPDPARRGCPDGDDDRDGVFNAQDQCRTVPAGLHPDPARLGCPQPDNDADSVPNPVDACPDRPGAPNSNPRLNGCPGLVLIQAGAIRIVQPVFFATGEDVILPTSFPVLQAVGEAIRLTAAIRRVSINGHTDDVGDDNANMDLSNRRAASVQRWLVEHGIEANRLEAHGFGETQPVRSVEGLRGRRARDARALNRRVEFRILDPQVDTQAPAAVEAPPAPGRRSRRHRSRH